MTCTLQCSTRHVSRAQSVKEEPYYPPYRVPLLTSLDGIGDGAGRCGSSVLQCGLPLAYHHQRAGS